MTGSVRPSVCPSVCPSVTPFSPCSHHRIIMKFSGVITIVNSDIHAKGQGQRSKVKVTEVNTQLSRFQTLTPIWIHIWQWNHAHSWEQHRTGALLFLAATKQLNEWYFPSVRLSVRNFGTFYFCLSYLLHKQAYVQLDEVTPVAGGLTLHSCYSLKEDINSFIEKWSSKICKPKEYFYEWKIKLLELIQTRGKSLKKKIKCRPVKKVLKDPDCLKELKKLKEQFVLVPIDKAANKIGFICKKYFLEVLLQETKSNTYVPHQDSAESIINAVAKKCLDIGIPVKGDNKTLPQIHATIKMHKNPVKFRFIIGARNCVTKQVAKKLVKILQLIMKIHRRYCNKIKFYTGIERFWIIENNAQVLEDIKFINSKRNARNIKTFDFSTLYTKIPLDDLKEKLKEIVDKAFKGGHNKYIQITSKTARWFHSKKNESFTKEDIFSMIDLVIDNSFFTFGD